MSCINLSKFCSCSKRKILSAVFAIFFLAIASSVFGADILLITGTRSYPGDLAIRQNLEDRGFSVIVVSDREVGIDHALKKDLVVISESVYSRRINTTLRNLPVPIIVSEPWLFHHMGMTESNFGVDFGTARRQSVLTIFDSPHQFTAALSGNVSIAHRNTAVGWGVPGKQAIKIATLENDTGRCPVFAYDKEAQMPGMAAPAKRVGFFLHRNSAAYLTSEGWALFDAAVDWCLAAEPPIPLTIKVISDKSWKTCAGEGCDNAKGWPELTEAPSHWRDAATGFAHLKQPSEMRPGTEAEMMWFCPPGVDPQSSSIPSMAYFHKTFNLPCLPEDATRAQAYVANPGKLSLYVNGQPILQEGRTLGEGGRPRLIDIRPALKEGQNAIAVFAQCGESIEKYVFLDIAIQAMIQPAAKAIIPDKTVLVVGRKPLNVSDRQIKMRLEHLGHLVDVVDDDYLAQSSFGESKLIVVSETVWSILVADRLTEIDVPVICFESYLYDDLKMTGSRHRKDYGNSRHRDSIYVDAQDHHIAALNRGQVKVTTRGARIGWGMPTESSDIIARLDKNSNKAAIFAYEAGAQMMDGLSAPARRVGMFPYKHSAKRFTDTGWALFDAAVEWATQE